MALIDEARLDDAAALEVADHRRMLRALATSGAQVRQSVTLAEEAGVARVNRGDRPRAVIVAGLGGSATVADLLAVLTEGASPVPVTPCRSTPLPGWVGALDLVVAVSQSGHAPGPLALAEEAARRGCGLLTVGAADSPLAQVCAAARGVHVPTPGAGPTTRTALWSLAAPVLLAAGRLGLAEVDTDLLARVADRLDAQAETCRPTSESFVNPAKSLALDLAETVPVVLGDGKLMGVAARRAAHMISRTGRIPATSGQLPDAASDVVACFDGPYAAGTPGVDAGSGERDIFADPYLDAPAQPQLGLLVLRDAEPEEPTPASTAAYRLAQAVVDSAQEAGARVRELSATAGAPLERLADQIALTDFAATYLALGLGLDPAISGHVTDLRERTS